MKKILVFALLMWNTIHIIAQITVTSSTFPVVGDKLRYVQAANPSVAVALYTPPGGNQSWDLSALTPASTFETAYRPATEGAYKNVFPEATIVVKNGTEEYYYRSSSTKFELLGHVTQAIGGLPLLAVYKNQPPFVERRAPLNFFDIYQQSNSNLLAWKFTQLPTGAFQIPATIDSVRFRISKQVVEAVDGWGTLKLPNARSFSVLRLKKTTYREQRIDAKVPPLGWLDVTDNVIKSGMAWAPLFGVDTTVTHHYYNDLSKEEIAVLTFNNQQNGVVKVVYKNTAISTPVVESFADNLPSLQVYPNPAVSSVTIRCDNVPTGVYTVQIWSSLGTLVKETTHFLTENIPIQVELPSDLNGLFICRLEDAKGKTVGTSQLNVMR